MSAAILAKLTAHGINITGAGFGGTPEITESDVAGAMAGMQRNAYEFMRLKYCADPAMFQPVVERVVYRLLGQSMTGEGPDSVSRIKLLGILIVKQATDGPLCDACNGTGVIVTDTTADDCGRCGGSGKHKMTQAKAGEFLGVSRQYYAKKYAHIVDSEVVELERLEGIGMAHIRKKIRRE